MWTVLYNSLVCWAELGHSPGTEKTLRGIPTTAQASLQRAMQEQVAIGWHHAFCGYLSKGWLMSQHQEHPKSMIQGLCSQWLKTVIWEIWTATTVLWEERNKKLHAPNPSTIAIKKSGVDAKIWQLYNIKEEFACSDRTLFDFPLEVRLCHI